MAKVWYKLPNGQFISKESDNTIATRDNRTGRLTGRRDTRGKGDRTKIMRVEKDFTIVKKTADKRGHIRKIKKEYGSGQIIGRI